MRFSLSRCLLVASILFVGVFCVAHSAARAQGVVFPANAGVLNVRDAKYGAKGDGVTDDTIAIQKALSEGLYAHRIVYLPDGVYRVSDTLRWWNGAQNNANGWGGFLQLQGQSRGGTILKLIDNAPGFGDDGNPKAVVATGSGAGDGQKHYTVGEGNEAFENHLRDFTVDTGHGNAGAIGIDFQASNCGAMRHITLRGEGYCGLSLMRRDNGPGLVKDVSIEGFRFGVRAQQELCHFTFEDVALNGQSESGIWVRDAIFGIRHLRSRNRVPAIEISGVALVNLFDSQLVGAVVSSAATVSPNAAVVVTGSAPRLFVRNLKATGYRGGIQAHGQTIANPEIDEWSSDDASGPLGANARTLNLPVRETPDWYDPDPGHWADAGAPSGGDDTAAIQAALDAGKSTVYFRYGTYHFRETLHVPRTVKRLMGMGTSLDVFDKLPNDAPLFRFVGGSAGDTTIVDRFTVGCKKGLFAEHADARTLVLRDVLLFDTLAYRNQAGSGPIFIEDMTATVRLDYPTQLWARQLNIESLGNPKIFNNGGTTWVLGWKSETGETLAENRNGGKMELWAGLPYTFGVGRDSPAFVNTDSSFAASFAGMTFVGGDNPFFNLLVRDTQHGQTHDYRRDTQPGRGGAVFLPLFVSAPQSTGERRMNWTTLAATAAVATTAATIAVAPPAAAQAATPSVPATPAKTYKLPSFLDGDKNGSASGNPGTAEGASVWRLDQVWTDDILQHTDYKPLVWGGQNWIAPDQKFGAASAKVENGNVTLGMRSAWGGSGDVAGSKLSALVFVAPATGHYTLTGTAHAEIWQGDNNVTLQILKDDGQKVTRLKTLPLPKDQDVPLTGIEADLQAGQELVLTAQIGAWYTGVNLALKDIKVTAGNAASSENSATTGDLTVGSIVTLNGHRYRVESAEGHLVVLHRLDE